MLPNSEDTHTLSTDTTDDSVDHIRTGLMVADRLIYLLL